MTSGQVKLIGDYDVIISALNKYLENFAQEKSQIHVNSFTDLEFVIIKDLLRVLIQLKKIALMDYLKKKQIEREREKETRRVNIMCSFSININIDKINKSVMIVVCCDVFIDEANFVTRVL